MNEHDTQFDHHPHEVGPEIDDSANPTDADAQMDAADAGAGQRPRSTAGREMLIQLQQMIDTVALQAGPVVREVAAKAAELAAVAGEKAGPVAHRAAAVTESVGQRVAARSKTVAADLRRPKGDEEGSEPAAPERDAAPGAAETTDSEPGESAEQI